MFISESKRMKKIVSRKYFFLNVWILVFKSCIRKSYCLVNWRENSSFTTTISSKKITITEDNLAAIKNNIREKFIY